MSAPDKSELAQMQYVSGHIMEAVRWDCPSCYCRGFVGLSQVLSVVKLSEKRGARGVFTVKCRECKEQLLVDPTEIHWENGTSLRIRENIQ